MEPDETLDPKEPHGQGTQGDAPGSGPPSREGFLQEAPGTPGGPPPSGGESLVLDAAKSDETNSDTRAVPNVAQSSQGPAEGEAGTEETHRTDLGLGDEGLRTGNAEPTEAIGTDPADLEETEVPPPPPSPGILRHGQEAFQAGEGLTREVPGSSGAEHAGGEAAAQQSGSASSGQAEGDDVFVILPEQVHSNIPVVQTEAVGGAPGPQPEPEEGEATETLDTGEFDSLSAPTGYGPGGADPLDFDQDDLEGGDATVIVDEGELDLLASELDDDEVLAGEADESPEAFEEEAMPVGEPGIEEEPSRSSSAVRWLVALAACALIGVAVWYYVLPELFPRTSLARSAQTSGADAAAVSGVQGSGDSTGTQGSASGSGAGDLEADPDGPVGSDPLEKERDATRQAFRQGVRVALSLGFTGDVVHEE